MRLVPHSQARRTVRTALLALTLTLLGSNLYARIASSQTGIGSKIAMASTLSAPIPLASSITPSAICREWAAMAKDAPNQRITIDYSHLMMLQHKIESQERSKAIPAQSTAGQ